MKDIDRILRDIRSMVETITFEQYECKLDPVKQELCKVLDSISGVFQFLTLGIKNEISLLTGHYRLPSHTRQSIIPELKAMVKNFEGGSVFGTVSFTESPLRETNVIAQNDAVVFKIEKDLVESFNEKTHKKFCRLRKEVLLEHLERLTLIVADLKAEIALLSVEEGEEGEEFN